MVHQTHVTDTRCMSKDGLLVSGGAFLETIRYMHYMRLAYSCVA